MKGSFSDISEVTAAVVKNDRSFRKVNDDLKNTTDDLGRRIEVVAKFCSNDLKKEGELKDDYTGSITDDLVNYFNRVEVEGDNTDNDKYIDSLFSSETTSEAFMVPLRQGNSTKSVCFRHVNVPRPTKNRRNNDLYLQ